MSEGARDIVTIRRATAADAAWLTPMFAEHRGADATDEKVDRYRERLARLVELPAHHILVAELGGRVIGYAAAQDYGPALGRDFSSARMHDLWVSPDARGHGAGRALFAAVREWAEGEAQIGFLEWQSSDVAVDFYRALGLSEATADAGRASFELDVNLPASP